MIDNSELLMLALALAFLGYNIGAMLLMMPIPFSGLKKWGPTLMKDSIYAMVLVLSSGTILGAVSYLQKTLNSDWGVLTVWIAERTAFLLGWKASLTAISAAISKLTGSVIFHSILEPLVKAVNYALATLYSIMSIGVIVKSYYVKLVVLGILLMSVPFRLTRAVGSYFIAFAIVFFIGLPFLPKFVDQFSQVENIQAPPQGGVEYGVIEVRDALGNAIGYPVVLGYVGGKLAFIYKGDSNGIVIAGFPDRGLPSNTSYTLELEYLGRYATLQPAPVEPSLHYKFSQEYLPVASVVLDVRAPLILYSPLPYVAVFRSENIEANITLSDRDRMVVIARAHAYQGYIELRFSKRCSVYSYHDGGVASYVNGTFSWRGIEGHYERFNINDNETARLEFVFRGCEGEPTHPSVREVSYMGTLGFSLTSDFTRLAASVVMSWVVLPAVYMVILGAVSSGLAYVIGGAREKVSFRAW
uniref:Uncharacterized protein n=1 Tax=Fervidicoccus fontis TaxID=683846 RepID=A0A7J3ZLX1_9CREN